MPVEPQPVEPTSGKPHAVTILVNNKEVQLLSREVTGEEIKQAAGIPLDFKLYDPQGSEIANEQQIKIHEREKFTAISGQDVS